MKDEKKVQEYKIQEADKYYLAMAINNAVRMIDPRKDDYSLKEYLKTEYPQTVYLLYKISRDIRIDILGY